MYEERKDSFSIKNVVIQFLFVALFIFILIWLFPMKGDLKDAINGMNKTTDTSVFYDRIFNENVIAMKDAAKDYFTTERLPKQVGETTKMTLGDMLEKKIILPFVDKDGNQCDIVSSYVEVTKHDNEFVMKVNLRCGEQENYLLVHMGCYDYCQTAICEKEKTDVKKPVVYQTSTNKPAEPTKPAEPAKPAEPVKPSTPDINIDIDIDIDNNVNSEPTLDPEPEKPETITEYEYQKYACSAWGEWSEWSEEKPTVGETLKGEYRVVKIKKTVGYETKIEYDYTQPIYEDQKYLAGTKTVTYCAKFGFENTGNVAYTNWSLQGYTRKSYIPSNTGTVKYVPVALESWICPEGCVAGRDYVLEVWTRGVANEAEYKCLETATETTSYYGTKKVLVGYKQVKIKEPIKEVVTVTQYRYATRTCGYSDSVWSTHNDKDLIDKGYEMTGNTRTTQK